jgi:lambda family phage portal protein
MSNFLTKFFGQPTPVIPTRTARPYQIRRYAGAGSQTTGLNGWHPSQSSADNELWGSLQILINRSRSLYRDDSNIFTAIEELCSLVIDRGLTLQSKIKLPDGEYNAPTNSLIEERFNLWANNPQWCDVTGTQTFWQMQSCAFRSQLVDGGVLVRLVPLPFGDSPLPLALELIEVDQLDCKTSRAPNGNEIRMGVEVDRRWRKPVAYWVLESHPGDLLAGQSPNGSRARRIPAGEVIHVFTQARPGQTRGVPAIAPGILKARNLLGLEESEVVKSRVQSCIAAFIENESPDFEPAVDEYGDPILDLFPGAVQYLNPGQKLSSFNPSAPNPNLPAFVQHFQRSLAGIFGLSAHHIHRDLSQANYSSLREGKLSEWRRIKGYRENLNRDLNCPVFLRWLDAAVVAGWITLPEYELAKQNHAFSFHGQPLDWVDPLKDLGAVEKQISLGLTTRTQVLAEKGLDYSDILAERAKEIALEKKYKVSFDNAPNRRNLGSDDSITVNLSLDGQTVSRTAQRSK